MAKYKYLTDEQVKTIDKLCADGHGETLMAFGLECKDIWETGFMKGFRKAIAYKCIKSAAVVAGVVTGFGIVGCIAEAVEKKNAKVDETKDETEVIDG